MSQSAVAAAVLLYVFSVSVIGSLGSIGGQQITEEVVMETYSFPSSTLTLTLLNVGHTSEDLANADYFVNGVRTTGTPTFSCASPNAVPPGGSCTVTLTVATTNLVSGQGYPLKIVTPSGGVFSYTITYGGGG